MRGGNILIAVHTETREQQRSVEEIMKKAGAHDVDTTSEASVPKEAARA